MTDHRIEYLPVASLRPWPKNARTHSRKQLRQIADSIRRFGFTNPVLIDGEATILAGHGRVAAAGLLEMAEVPCVRIETMTAAEKRAYVIADNKLALNAGWDEELQALLAVDLVFNVGLTGFSIPEIDSLIEGLAPEEPGDPAEDVLPPEDGPALCRPGDIWQLGPHRLICGSALQSETVTALTVGSGWGSPACPSPCRTPITSSSIFGLEPRSSGDPPPGRRRRSGTCGWSANRCSRRNSKSSRRCAMRRTARTSQACASFSRRSQAPRRCLECPPFDRARWL